MTHTKQFIEDAVSGGWKKDLLEGDTVTSIDSNSATIDGHFYIRYFDNVANQSDMWNMDFFRMLLDPLAWQAVAEVRGWTTDTNYFRPKMHDFIDHLANGHTIEHALGLLADKMRV